MRQAFSHPTDDINGSMVTLSSVSKHYLAPTKHSAQSGVDGAAHTSPSGDWA